MAGISMYNAPSSCLSRTIAWGMPFNNFCVRTHVAAIFDMNRPVCSMEYKLQIWWPTLLTPLREAKVRPSLGNSNRLTLPDTEADDLGDFSVHAKHDEIVSRRSANSHNALIGPDFGAPCSKSIRICGA